MLKNRFSEPRFRRVLKQLIVDAHHFRLDPFPVIQAHQAVHYFLKQHIPSQFRINDQPALKYQRLCGIKLSRQKFFYPDSLSDGSLHIEVILI